MPHFNRSIWAMVVFLLGFALLIWIVSNQFLFPALAAANSATLPQKQQLVAYSRLILAIVLLILCVGILILFRVRRFFFPSPTQPRQKTQYVDAWTEAGKRHHDGSE